MLDMTEEDRGGGEEGGRGGDGGVGIRGEGGEEGEAIITEEEVAQEDSVRRLSVPSETSVFSSPLCPYL